MSAKYRKRHVTEPLIQTVIAAALGMGLTFILTLLGAWMILRGSLEESTVKIWVPGSVFLGSFLASALNRSVRGLIPGAIANVVAYFALLLLLSFPQSSSIKELFSLAMVTSVSTGSIAGKVTNLVKSNKSYINKSKRKRSIT